MTDLEKFIELYSSIGIKLNTYVDKDKRWNPNGYTSIILEQEDGWHKEGSKSDKITGYSGFYSILLFDKTGKFIEQSFNE